MSNAAGNQCPKCGSDLRVILCARCFGTGKAGKHSCKVCGGTGTAKDCPNSRSHSRWPRLFFRRRSMTEQKSDVA